MGRVSRLSYSQCYGPLLFRGLVEFRPHLRLVWCLSRGGGLSWSFVHVARRLDFVMVACFRPAQGWRHIHTYAEYTQYIGYLLLSASLLVLTGKKGRAPTEDPLFIFTCAYIPQERDERTSGWISPSEPVLDWPGALHSKEERLEVGVNDASSVPCSPLRPSGVKDKL